MPGPTLLIANPASRGGRTPGVVASIAGHLEGAFGPMEQLWSSGPGDAGHLAYQAALDGAERLVVAGGDGTLREVAGGVLEAGRGTELEIVPLPLGTGGDWLRSLGVPRNIEQAIDELRDGKTRAVDAGRVAYTARDGSRARTWFVNVASCGLSGLVTERVNRGRKRLGGRLAFLLGTLQGLVEHRSVPVRLELDDRCIFQGPLVLAAAANGSTFGGGMRVAPDARIDDGLLDVVVIGGVAKRTFLLHLPRVYRGTHPKAPGVSVHRGARLRAELMSEPGAPRSDVWIELDGDPLGRLPAEVELVPGALRMRGVRG